MPSRYIFMFLVPLTSTCKQWTGWDIHLLKLHHHQSRRGEVGKDMSGCPVMASARFQQLWNGMPGTRDTCPPRARQPRRLRCCQDPRRPLVKR
ncbi:uncharacterized protein B0T23DRAFT_386365 [Neurospora hispaniola]|uniref:Uncharacterized protein n=1 Tax=Neurospora hispaniola TaxID=588809 RepID=A0AAJ0I216_9PEZI|nr:hypothetical protein B0T23DRAFT_386365 [Neurospora hispaniola]